MSELEKDGATYAQHPPALGPRPSFPPEILTEDLASLHRVAHRLAAVGLDRHLGLSDIGQSEGVAARARPVEGASVGHAELGDGEGARVLGAQVQDEGAREDARGGAGRGEKRRW